MRCRDSVKAADGLVKQGLSFDALNRIYYACFYAVSALLLSEGHASKKHAGIAAEFDLHFVIPGRLPRNLGKFYHQMLRARLQGDYGKPFPGKQLDAADWLKRAMSFVDRVLIEIPSSIDPIPSSGPELRRDVRKPDVD